MLALTVLVLLVGSHNRIALGIAGAGGVVGLALAFWLARRIQTDVDILARALRPADESLGGETFSSSWGVSTRL